VKPGILAAFFALCLCVCSALATPRTTEFKFQLRPGPYPVGLQVVHQYDRSRSFSSASVDSSTPSANVVARPLQTLIWYPSVQSTAESMTVGDYVQLADTEIHFNLPNEKENRWRSLLKGSFDIPLWSVRNATPGNGGFPVLVYAPSDSSVSWENAELCEYLASHGYVVLASPSMGASTRDMTDDLDGINSQARDISFLITYAESLPDVDSSQVAIVSWSWGGISSLFASARDSRIDALIEMDGSLRYYSGLVKKAEDIHPERMSIPLLFFTRNVSLEELDNDGVSGTDKDGPNILNVWTHGDLYTANMLGMAHPEFSSMFQRRETAQRFAENQVADYGRDDANTSYAWVALYTLNFLDSYLKHEVSARAFLKKSPAENGVPKHLMATKFRSAQ
jgi:hypothetical protein